MKTAFKIGWTALFLILALAWNIANAQVANTPNLGRLRVINAIPMGTVVPATCVANEVFGETDLNLLWVCESTDTWEAYGTFDHALNHTVTGDWVFQGTTTLGDGTDKDNMIDIDLASGDFGFGWDEDPGRFLIPHNLTVGTPVDEDSLIWFNTATGGTLRFGWSVANAAFFIDREIFLPDDRGIQFNSTSGGADDVTEFGWHGGTERFVLTAIGTNGFDGQLYVDETPSNLPGTCQSGAQGLDNSGVSIEFCVCDPDDTWNCVVMATGAPD